MSSDKPYLAGSREYLELQRSRDWWDEDVNPNDNAEYSELQKPYALGEDDDDSYPAWEWTWPDIDLPEIPPIIRPDPVENPCSIDEDCVWAGIIGANEIECGDCYTYTQAHIYYGCDLAPWWAAFGSWTVEFLLSSGGCEQVFTGPIMTTVCCDDDAEGTIVVTYDGPLDCKGSFETAVTCSDCCGDEGTTLTGADNVDAGDTWTGTIDPACNGFSCRVTSNSECIIGCSINEAGSQVTVDVPGAACGSFTVTIWDTKSGCGATASAIVRINDNGTWRSCGSDSCAQGAFCSGPWCGGDQQGPGSPSDNSHYFEVYCFGGGTCQSGDRTCVCDDGYSVGVTLAAYCCNGCQDCVADWTAIGGQVYVWECDGACGT